MSLFEDLSQSASLCGGTGRKSLILKRRDVRVVEGARLESVCRGNSTEGSNPSLSAKLRSRSFVGASGLQAGARLSPRLGSNPC